MTNLVFTRATKEQAKLRLAIYGPSGSGKTYSALRIATGMGGRIAVIDTERGSASKYADRFEFDVLELPQNDIATYVEGIQAAAGYAVLIIDSLTHAWRELLEEVDRIAKARYSGNRWSAWSEGNPKQNGLIESLLSFDGHVLATMRSKTEWVIEQNVKGRNEPRRVGLGPEQGKNIEYEFDLLMELSAEHVASVTKDRTGKFQDRIIERPDETFGAELAAWLREGAAPRASATTTGPNWINDDKRRASFLAWVKGRGLTHEQAHEALDVPSLRDYGGTPAEAKAAIEKWIAANTEKTEG